MKNQIQDLIKDYQKQVKRYDYELNIIKQREIEIRDDQSDDYYNELDDLFDERQIKNAQRQRTVQFVSDLKSL